MDIIQTIQKFVEDECKKPSSKYGYEPFIHHFIPMVAYANILADAYGGDKEIILLAAWLHDIGSIIYGRENHEQTGASVAEEKLSSLRYPKEKMIHVVQCIRNHRGSKNFVRKSIEEQIVAEADALSNLDNISGIFHAAYVYEHLNQHDARISVRTKIQNKWKQLHFPKSQTLIRIKYEAAMLLLK